MTSIQSTSVSILELRRLLGAIIKANPTLGIRFRLLGKMWQSTHHQVYQLTRHGVILEEKLTGNLVLISDLNNVIQFDLDGLFQFYQPNTHYSIVFQHSVVV